MIVYDCETIRPILKKNQKMREGYTYATGWEDYRGMGISVACFYNYENNGWFYLIDKDFEVKSENFYNVQKALNSTSLVSGFNIEKFDNNLIREWGLVIDDNKCYDILKMFWASVGLDPNNYNYRTHGGYNLDRFLEVNTDVQKTMNGLEAPFMWQDGKEQEVIDYCINDVVVEGVLLEKIFENGGLIDPKTKKLVRMPIPRSM